MRSVRIQVADAGADQDRLTQIVGRCSPDFRVRVITIRGPGPSQVDVGERGVGRQTGWSRRRCEIRVRIVAVVSHTRNNHRHDGTI